MQIAIDIPSEKADFMVEVLNSFSFVKGVFAVTDEEAVSSSKRMIGLLDGGR
jgi:glycerol uptake facilitator-like aquaporin